MTYKPPNLLAILKVNDFAEEYCKKSLTKPYLCDKILLPLVNRL
jgi:hypothetical protein